MEFNLVCKMMNQQESKQAGSKQALCPRTLFQCCLVSSKKLVSKAKGKSTNERASFLTADVVVVAAAGGMKTKLCWSQNVNKSLFLLCLLTHTHTHTHMLCLFQFQSFEGSFLRTHTRARP